MRSSAKKTTGEKAFPLLFQGRERCYCIYPIRPAGRSYRFKALGLIPGASVLIERTFPSWLRRYIQAFSDNELAENILVYPTESLKVLKKQYAKEKIGKFSFYLGLK